ncbi:hypothetical protein Desku_1115 [Desulfofundulus kuznetsovii DSM 6115]|uniref:Phage protein n=1 Tax=Desulfofundulus kuznetsovii (strain DSM 6115 / VKM B-1805 / 17) TaxID=760568 RepID=A0AAU8P9N6_DESK7|nr:hypothetical protein Desku_1115 [Desulfofundulus kuznetsovii DSM 6115]
MITPYLKQTAIWKQTIGYDLYGQPLTASTSIPVRWEGKRRLVRNAQGEQVVSEARVFTTHPIQPGDILSFGGRDWPVIAVSEVPTLDGAVLYREVSV